MSIIHPNQTDLFETPLFESRQPIQTLDMDRFRLRMKTAMAAAIRDSGIRRDEIARSMSDSLRATVSKTMLDAYTSPAKQHDISLVRFKALTRSLPAPGLWDIAVSDEGLIVIEGDEARLAEIARLQQEQRVLSAKIRAMRSVPVDIKRGR